MGEQDKPTRDSGVWRPMGGEGAAQRASDDDDVEGHKFMERAAQRGTPDDDDVEGHAAQRGSQRAAQRGTPGDDDVEGHAAQRATPGDDDDVEGHKQTR